MSECCGCMPCFSLLRRPDMQGEDKALVDIEKHLKDFAWDMLANPTWSDRLFKSRRFDMEVNWSYLDIQHKVTRFKVRAGQHQASTTMQELKDKQLHRDLCLFSTEFRNNSSKEQSFTFKTERSTKSTATVSVQKGFQIGGNLSLSMSVPVPGQEVMMAAAAATGSEIEPCKVTGGLSGQLNITQIKGQTFEESLTWSVDTQIKVSGNTGCRAELMIREKELHADFTVQSTIRPLGSDIPVYLKHKSSDQRTILEINSDILHSHILTKDRGFMAVEEVRVSPNQKLRAGVQCDNKGTFSMVYGAEQYITIQFFPLNDQTPKAMTTAAETEANLESAIEENITASEIKPDQAAPPKPQEDTGPIIEEVISDSEDVDAKLMSNVEC